MKRKKIPDSVLKMLCFASGNQCCFPECPELFVSSERKGVLAQICHIIPVKKGPRYEENFPEAKKNAIENLLLMCPNHHLYIDTDPVKYDKHYLYELKRNHEIKFVQKKPLNENEGELSSNLTNILNDQNVLEVVASLKKAISLEEDSIKSSLSPSPYKKKEYPIIPNYISRKLSPVISDEVTSFSGKSLPEIVLENKRVTILGVAGSGKSIELGHLAHTYSISDSSLIPVKVRLNYIGDQSIEDILSIEYPEIKKIPDHRLLVILDALDEVHSDYLDKVTNNIILFSKTFLSATIVVSCRNNFYITETLTRSAKLTDFSTFVLNPLGDIEIRNYIEEQLLQKADDLIVKLKQEKLYSLLFSPFYLTNLVLFYKKNQRLPSEKKEIFEYLINKRIIEDLDKYKNTGISLDDYQHQVESIIEKLAVLAECLGRNYLEERGEFLKVVGEPKLIRVVKHTFLFNKTHGDKWEFEHNNFQEFLAAKYLSRLDFVSIQRFVSFEFDYKKIRPSWLNTLSFLFSILPSTSELHSRLLEWLVSIEPDVLIRFERERIDLSSRETIFKQIYESYELKGIIIRNEKFESDDLARFVSDSTSILEFLIEKAEKGITDLKITEAIRLFKYFDKKSDYELLIKQILLKKILDPLTAKRIKHDCISQLISLGIIDTSITKQLLAQVDQNTNQYYMAGVYKYLLASGEHENHVDLYLKGIKRVSKSSMLVSGSSTDHEPHFGDDQFNLEKVLEKLKKSDNVAKILNWFADQKYISGSFYFTTIRDFIEKAEQIYLEGEHSIFDSVLNLFESFGRKYQKDLNEEFETFFTKTSTRKLAFTRLYDRFKNSDESVKLDLSSLGNLTRLEDLDFLFLELKQKQLTVDQIFKLRNALNWGSQQEVFGKFYAKLARLNKGQYKYPTQKNYAVFQKERKKKDLMLLFSPSKFVAEAKKIFDLEQKNELSEDELWDYRKAHMNDDIIDNNIVIDTLREHVVNGKKVSLKEIEKIVNNKKSWEWFTVNKLIRYDSNDSAFIFSPKAIKFIKGWVKSNLPNANFVTAITENGNGSYHYRYLEMYIPYFVERLKIKLKTEYYLNFLLVDCYLIPHKAEPSLPASIENDEDEFQKHKTISKYIIASIGLEKVKQRIVENIKKGKLISMIEKNHFLLCKKHKIDDCNPILLDRILSNKYSAYEKRGLIDTFIYLNGNPKKILEMIPELDEELKLHALRVLAEKKFDGVAKFCTNSLKDVIDETQKIEYINIMLKINSSAYFHYFKEWVIQNQTLPDRPISTEDLTLHNLSDILDVYEMSLTKPPKNRFWMDGSEYLTAIVELGSKNSEAYSLVKGRIEVWINQRKENSYLHYQLQKLELQYYANRQGSMTIQEAISLVSS